MKLWNFTALLALLALAACSKEDISDTDPVAVASIRTQDVPPAVVSGWERAVWSVKDSAEYRVSFDRRQVGALTADILESGAVLVWIRNVPSVNGEVISKPLLMPFHVLPEGVHPAYDEKWYFTPQPALLDIEFRTNKYLYVPSAATVASSQAEFRYFIIPPETLDRMGLNRITVLQLPYQRLLYALGINE
ncbi:MAG TPA: hypothetical protein VFZ78_06290 [Flavisolibacter sp.]